jgi:hypothetical protein
MNFHCPAIRLCPELEHHIALYEDYFNIIFQFMPLSPTWYLSFMFSDIHFSYLPCLRSTPPN